MKLIITRFEALMVVCEDKKGKQHIFEHKKLPAGATEGNIIKKTLTGKYIFDTDEEMLREHRMKKMMDNQYTEPEEAELKID